MLCQFLVLAGKRFWFNFGSNTYLLLRVKYSCGGALFFYLQWEIVFGGLCCCGSGDYDRKKKVPVVCLAGCQFLVLAITTGKKKSSSRLSGGLVLAITTKK